MATAHWVNFYDERCTNAVTHFHLMADFGKAASLTGIYDSERSGFHEHNLYSLRYNKAVAEVTEEVTDESITWARSACA